MKIYPIYIYIYKSICLYLYRLRSGNPGYVIGLPVLYGFLNSNYDTIEELVVGFTVPSSFAPYNPESPKLFGKSICPTSSYTRGMI